MQKHTPLKLGRLALDAPFFLAPLSGYSDLPMRLIARRHGVPLAFSGLILDKSTSHPKVLRRPNLLISPDEHPVGAQLLGTDPALMAQAARNLVDHGYDLIDLNFACPAPKVVAKQRGGYLLSRPHVALDIFRAVRAAVSCPVLMKLRIGFDSSAASRGNFWWLCRQAAADGVDGLVVHGRTVHQRFSGHADWDILAELKQRLPDTTIIGSGDLLTAEHSVQRLTSSGVDGLVLARGAIGNPWIYREINALLAGTPKPPPPSLAQQADVLRRHFDMILQYYPPRKAVILFRKFTNRYCRLHPQRKKVQHDLITAQTPDQLHAAVTRWYSS